MKNFRNIFSVLVIALSAVIFASCQSKEEKVISHLQDIEKTLNEKTFEGDDLEAICQEFKDVMELANECEFTPEQKKEVGALAARITVAAGKQSMNQLGGFLKGAVDYGKGFMDEMEESGSDELEDAVNEISNLFN